ncbi:monocyte chemotactic protein 1B-like [Carettochelys insculpta]|uniref:monocyte chemotactic protein 1B-like n=1 Tax=Carettochelys insculpta TaxID=44489 RepID=UPI003EBE9CF7
MISLRTALLVATLLAVSCQYATAKLLAPVECCFTYTSDPIQISRLVDFYRTPSECARQAVVLETRAGHKVCSDPSKPWVKRAMRILQGKKKHTENHV